MRLFAGTEFDIPPRCERCEQLEEDCTCPPEPAPQLDPTKQTARVRLEKRKRGKVVTVVQDLTSANNDLPALLSRLKTTCGAGGSLKDDVLEVQGSHVERVAACLGSIGYRVKMS